MTRYLRAVLPPLCLGLVIALTGGCATVPGAATGTAPEAATPPATSSRLEPNESFSPHVLYGMLVGEIAGQRGEFGVSAQHYLEAARRTDDPRIAQRALGLALQAGDTETALEVARRWAKLVPDESEPHQALASLALRGGHMEEASEQVESLLAMHPDRGEGWRLVTTLLAGSDNSAAAVDLVNGLMPRHAAEPDAWIALARLAVHAGDVAAASTALERALELRPDWPPALVLRAQVLLGAGQVDEALAGLSAAVDRQPRERVLGLAYARMLIETDRLDEARVAFGRLEKFMSDDPDVLFALGVLALDSDQPKAAEGYFKRMVAGGQRVPVAMYYLGQTAEIRKRPAEALKWYEQVTEGQYAVDAQVRAVRIRAERGELGLAREALARLRARHPRAAVRFFLVEGEILDQAGQRDEALGLYTKLLDQFPDVHELRYSRALLAEKMDRLDLAESDLRYIVEREPTHVHALNALGYTLADRTDRYPEALEYIQRALMLAPDDPAVIDSMGWVLYRMGNLEEARQYLQRAWDLTGDAEIAAHLGEVLWVSGQRDEARKIWQLGRDNEADNPALLETIQRLAP